jgi:enoyl-CoA hydratase/carnithine racemase
MAEEVDAVLLGKDGGIARITLNRPGRLNAYNMQMRDDLWQALLAVRDDPEVRVVLLSGAGERAFCAGADLTEFGTAPSQAIARRVRRERPIWELWASLPKPFVAALHGHVIGSGVEMAMLCDLRVASEDAVFRMPEVALGMLPAAGGTQTVPRTLGIPAALELELTNRAVTASEALRWGLAHRVVPRERLMAEAEGLARRLAELSPSAAQAAKRAVVEGADLPLRDGLAMEERRALEVAGASQG